MNVSAAGGEMVKTGLSSSIYTESLGGPIVRTITLSPIMFYLLLKLNLK